MKIDWPIVFAFACCLCMAGLSTAADLPSPQRDVFGWLLVGGFIALGIGLWREIRTHL